MKKPYANTEFIFRFQAALLLLAGVFIPLYTNAQDNRREKVFQYAVANEQSFWRQVSRFYPLSKEQILEYRELLDFPGMAANENMEWTPSLIDVFIDEWHSDLVNNKAIDWNQDLIELYVDKDWFTWESLTYRREIILSPDFFSQHKNEIQPDLIADTIQGDSIVLRWAFDSYSPPVLVGGFLLDRAYDRSPRPAGLTAIVDQPIESVPVDTLILYANWTDKYRLSTCQTCTWTLDEIERLAPYLNLGSASHNKNIYDTLFREIIDNAFLQQVYEKQFPKDEIRYYFLEKGEDAFGITPAIQFKGKEYLSFAEKMDLTNVFPDTLKKSKYLLSNGEPPIRFVDFLEFSQPDYKPAFTALFVSPRLKTILEQTRLPKHKYYPITIEVNDPIYGSDTMSYYVLLLENDPASLIDPEKMQLINSKQLYKRPIISTDKRYQDFFDHPDYSYFIDSLKRREAYEDLLVPSVHLSTYFDLFAIRTQTYISPRLHKALSEARISGYNPIMYEDDPVARIAKSAAPNKPIQLANEVLPDLISNQRTVVNYRTIQATKAAILNAKPVMNSIYAASGPSAYIDDPILTARDSMVRQLEINWDVQLPDYYRDALIRNKLPYLGKELYGFIWYDIDQLFQTDKRWHYNYPQTVKAIVVSGTGDGGYALLFLEPGSHYKIGTLLFKSGDDSRGFAPTIDLNNFK